MQFDANLPVLVHLRFSSWPLIHIRFHHLESALAAKVEPRMVAMLQRGKKKVNISILVRSEGSAYVGR